MSPSKRVIFSSKATFYINKGLTTPQDFLLSHKCASFILPKKSLLIFRKSVTHKFLCLTILSSVLFSRKRFRSLYNCLWPCPIDERWLVSFFRSFFSWRACLFKITLHEQAKFLNLSSQLFLLASFSGQFFSKTSFIEIFATAVDNYFSLWFFVSRFMTVPTNLWKSDNPISIGHESWKLLGQFVKMISVQEGFSGFLKHVDLLIILVRL